MRAVVQRVTEAAVLVEKKIVASIKKGIVVFIAVKADDTDKAMDYIVNKIKGLRIFEDEQGKMNLSVQDTKGEILIVPNFTVYGSAVKGMRPSFIASGSVEEARKKYEKFLVKLQQANVQFQTGIFQADMKVTVVNDGPVTILLDSDKLF